MPNSRAAARDTSQSAKLLSFTIDPSTAQIVKLEALDASGARHELSDGEKASLVKGRSEQTLERVVERAFEAGMACVLDGESESEDKAETSEDMELTHRLLVPLIEHSAARKLIARDALDRAILDTLIEHSMTNTPAARAGTSAAF